MSAIVQSLWIGDELSPLEQLSIRSFLANGHEYHLYAYRQPRYVPPGALCRDASRILPETAVFQYRGHASYAGFANFFRYCLLLRHGGWWADTDVICLRPFDFAEEYVFASEPDGAQAVVTNAVLKTPSGCGIMRRAAEICASKDPATLVWGETGPKLLGAMVRQFELDRRVVPPATFCPVPFREWERILSDEEEIPLPADCLAIHLWNEMWRRNGCDKNQPYPAGSLYERLKQRFAPSYSAG